MWGFFVFIRRAGDSNDAHSATFFLKYIFYFDIRTALAYSIITQIIALILIEGRLAKLLA